MLVWIDLETTGLVATQEKILEVACIITDDALNEIARFERVTTEAKHHDLSQVSEYVLKMHATNGLWCESLLAEAQQTIGQTDYWLDMFITNTIITHTGVKDSAELVNFVGSKSGPQLAGSTISFDRAFMQEHLPRAHGLLHYRNHDVSTLNEIAKRVWPAVFEGRPRPAVDSRHRAMGDIEDSLAVARYYVRVLGPLAG